MRRFLALALLVVGAFAVACTDTPTATLDGPDFATADPPDIGWCSAGLSEQGTPYNPNVMYVGFNFDNLGTSFTPSGYEYVSARFANFSCKVYKTYPQPGWVIAASCTQLQTRTHLTDPWEGYIVQPGEFSCLTGGM